MRFVYYIVPDLGDISFVGFGRVLEAEKIGEHAARLKADELLRFSADADRWAAFDARPRARPHDPIEIDRVRLDNTSHVDDRIVGATHRAAGWVGAHHCGGVGEVSRNIGQRAGVRDNLIDR